MSNLPPQKTRDLFEVNLGANHQQKDMQNDPDQTKTSKKLKKFNKDNNFLIGKQPEGSRHIFEKAPTHILGSSNVPKVGSISENLDRLNPFENYARQIGSFHQGSG